MNLKTFLAVALVVSLSVPVQVIANGRDCTLTAGYWKTHSEYGPANPMDPYWSDFANQAFYLSGQTWFEVMRTPPRGNSYYILANQFVAAFLNNYAGAAAPPEILDALAGSMELFNNCDPSDVARDDPVCDRADFLALASILSDYNEGYIGPGACIECPCFDDIETGEPYYATGMSAIAPCDEPYLGEDQISTSFSFFFEDADPPFVVNIGRGQACDGTVTASCFGGPAGTFSLTPEQWDQCIQGPGWPALIPD